MKALADFETIYANNNNQYSVTEMHLTPIGVRPDENPYAEIVLR